MISLPTLFWIMIIFFGLIGTLRGWGQEAIAAAGLVLSLFTQLWFGHYLVELFVPDASTPEQAWKIQFYVRAAAHLLITFFAYQGPTIARRVSSGKFGNLTRSNVQDSLLGFVIGVINGYLVVGALWSFLEFDIGADKLITRYGMGIPYPFRPEIIKRMFEGAAWEMGAWLPLPLLQAWLPFMVVVFFLFVIVVMI